MAAPFSFSPDLVHVSHKISEGAFAQVFAGDHLGTPVAIKIPKPTKKGAARAAEREIRVMQRLCHSNICTFYGSYCTTHNCITDPQHDAGSTASAAATTSMTLVTELLDGDLRRLVQHPELLPCFHERLTWLAQAAEAILYMHNADFVHQDIKLENILFRSMPDGTKLIKLCDFGLTRRMLGPSFSNPSRIGTALYMSPEVLQASEHLTQKVDVYCFAFAMWELLAAQKAFANHTKFSQLRMAVLIGNRPLIPGYFSKRIHALIQSCWASSPVDRPTMAQVVDELYAILKDGDITTTMPQAAAFMQLEEPLASRLGHTAATLPLCLTGMPTELA